MFDRSRLKDGDAVSDFFDLLGIDNFERIDEKNTSLGFLEAKIGHLLNASHVQHKSWMIELLMPRIGPSEKLLPSRNDALKFYRHYIDSNKQLNKRFKITKNRILFSNDFDMYPREQADTWNEESANNAIKKILQTVDNVYGGLTVDDMREAAIALERTKPELSLKLMHMAHKIRPKGTFIRKKLNEYKRRLEAKSEE